MSSGYRHGYDDIEEIKDPDGVVAVISRRRSNGALTVAIFRTYERDGVAEKTGFFTLKHVAGVRRVLQIAEERIEKLEAAATPTEVRLRG